METAMKSLRHAAVAAVVALGLALTASAQDVDKIRKTLAERVPQMGKVDDVAKTPMPGLYEVRVGTDLFYTDADGNFLIQGMLMDTKQQRNLTEERQEKLLVIPFDQLPFKDAFTIVRGNGKRKVAIFEDPNCPYCKRFEQDLQKVKDVTVYMFLYPILGPDSTDKSRNLWCSKDRGAAWLDWMLHQKAAAEASCDIAAVNRNVEFGHKYHISGTPTMILTDGRRVPGAMPPDQVEKLLAESK
jgi:thiol:disulfide interchange protein DsbC